MFTTMRRLAFAILVASAVALVALVETAPRVYY
jgi:hypothetical protein